MVGGSYSPPRSPTAVHFATREGDRALLKERAGAWEAHFRTAAPEALKPHVLDTRALHRTLYEGLVPDLPEAAGTYRGTPGTLLQHARREVRLTGDARGLRDPDPCAEPWEVAGDMDALTGQIARYYEAPDRVLLARIVARFVQIHPYLDGNGHIVRLIFIALARQGGGDVSRDWTVHERPHDLRFSVAVQAADQDIAPMTEVLDAYLVRP